MRKLTDKQIDLLKAIQAGVGISYMPYMGRFNEHAYYYRQDTHGRCTKQIEALISRGLLERSKTGDWRTVFKIQLTKEGKEFK